MTCADWLPQAATISGATISATCSLPSVLQDGPLVLEAPFHGFTAKQVALLLRFVYRPELITTGTFRTLQPQLPALLRLAHQLDVRDLVKALSAYMIGAPGLVTPVASGCSAPQCARLPHAAAAAAGGFVPVFQGPARICPPSRSLEKNTGASLEMLVEWTGMAQACQLDYLAAGCIYNIARKLVVGQSPKTGPAVREALTAAQALQPCGHSTLLQLIAVLTAAANPNQLGARVNPEALQAAAAAVPTSPVSERGASAASWQRAWVMVVDGRLLVDGRLYVGCLSAHSRLVPLMRAIRHPFAAACGPGGCAGGAELLAGVCTALRLPGCVASCSGGRDRRAFQHTLMHIGRLLHMF